MKILVIANYPTPSVPQNGIFVYRFVQELEKQGQEVTVVSPKKATIKNILQKFPYKTTEKLYQPITLSFSNKHIFGFNTYKLTHSFFVRSARRVIEQKKISFDIVYCHFFASAFYTMDIIKDTSKSIFLGFGESTWYNDIIVQYSKKKNDELNQRIKGFIAVSNKNKIVLEERGINDSDILVAPNAVDTTIFYKRDKKAMRQKYHIALNYRIISFVGHFDENKGYRRVLKAIKDLHNVYGIFLGDGEIKEDYGKIILKGIKQHSELAEILSASDVFVLPTRSEGSCNAIVEAMSCGLPIISSNIDAIKEQCDSSFAILVNPDNVEQIRKGIASVIYDDNKLFTMSQNAIIHSKKYNIVNRVEKIIKFINEKQ